MAKQQESEDILKLLDGATLPTSDQFKKLVTTIDSHTILAKVFLLEGPTHVFSKSPMKYVIFKEQVAERFNVGSQDVCIVGSAKLGFSPSSNEKYGRPFQDTSDVDVVIISDELFHQGSSELFKHLNQLGPPAKDARENEKIEVKGNDWANTKDAIRNYVFNNFNPALLPTDNTFKQDVFGKIKSTSGLFLALEPKIFVSKIRCRIFRTWKAAEGYYSYNLEALSRYLQSPDKQHEITTEDEAGEPLSPQ